MDEPATIVAKKIVNALIKSAELGFPMDAEVKIALKFFKANDRGLWVGGTMYLLPDCLDFRPNAMNRFVHKDNMSRRVPLADITSVTDRFGIATRVVTVALRDGTEFKFRCYGAAEFAHRIRDQMQVSGPPIDVQPR